MSKEESYTMEEFELVARNIDQFTDAQVEHIFYETEVATKDDIIRAVETLKVHRPVLLKKIESQLPPFSVV